MKPDVVTSASRGSAANLEQYTEERCYIVETWNDAVDPDVSVARARIEPGVYTAWHSLAVDERYIVTSGHGRVELDDRPPELVAEGDVVLIPAGARQRIQNIGATDLIFYCVCTPRFEPQHYTHLEESTSE